MRYCSNCGAPVSRAIPAGDQRERYCCNACGTVHYENPKVVVGCVLEWQGAILLCRRAIEPRIGFWTLPAGFLENGESIAAGAMRETVEEAGANAAIEGLFAVLDVPRIHQVHMFFRGRLRTDSLSPGIESMDARLFDAPAIPWKDLAFPSVRCVLEHYLNDRSAGSFGTHAITLADDQSSR
jgi:ADP-ribose pyrophosphatase YjhB (NUDIX family)